MPKRPNAVQVRTRVGRYSGFWLREDGMDQILWQVGGGIWWLLGRCSPGELRRVAEEIAAGQPFVPPPVSQSPSAPEPVPLAEVQALVPAFNLPAAFLQKHGAQLGYLRRRPSAPPHGVQVAADRFSVFYLGPLAPPLWRPGFRMLATNPGIGGRNAVWWRREDRLAVSWPAQDRGRWRVEGRLTRALLRCIAHEVAASTTMVHQACAPRGGR